MILRHIRYMLAVAEHRNFTRASEALHVSQPALSQQIKQLEETLGVQLFDRTGRTVRPTDMGSVYIEYARRSLVDLEAGRHAILDVRDLSHGELRLAMTPTFTEYLVAPLVERFSAKYPGITLSVCEMTLDNIELALSDDRVDLGIDLPTYAPTRSKFGPCLTRNSPSSWAKITRSRTRKRRFRRRNWPMRLWRC